MGDMQVTGKVVGNDWAEDGSYSSATAIESPSLLKSVDAMVSSGDPGAAIAALAIKAGRDQREVTRAQRDAEDKAEVAATDRQVASMHHKADMILAAGIAQGASEMASGAMTMGSAACQYRSDTEKLSNTTSAQQASASDAKAAGLYKGGSQLATATGSLVSAYFKSEEAKADADATEAEHEASRAKRATEDLHDDMGDAQKLVEKALDFYKEYKSTKDQTALAASRRS